MTHGSLFSGIGGFDLAAQWVGFENLFQVEIDPFCKKVLEKNFPQVSRYADIKEFDGTKYRGAVDIVSGGFPCQPFSVAGKRKSQDDNRYLWPEMLRVIREVKPKFVVGENVPGILSLALDQVLTSLEDEGYKTETYIIPACALNAPHRRDRVWIVAYGNCDGFDGAKVIKEDDNRRFSKGVEEGHELESLFGIGTATNAYSQRLQRREEAGNQENRKREGGSKIHSTGRSHGYLGDSWEVWPTQSPVLGRNDGISNRVDRIKALGNAIVPQIAYEIFKAIKQLNHV